MKLRLPRWRSKSSRSAGALAIFALALAGLLAYHHLRPTSCRKCEVQSARFRTQRLVRGWRRFLPDAELAGERPVVCRACFDSLLQDSPAKDAISRQALATYLTDPAAAQPVLEALSADPREAAPPSPQDPLDFDP